MKSIIKYLEESQNFELRDCEMGDSKKHWLKTEWIKDPNSKVIDEKNDHKNLKD